MIRTKDTLIDMINNCKGTKARFREKEEQIDPVVSYEGRSWFYDAKNSLLVDVSNYENRMPFGIIPDNELKQLKYEASKQ